MMTLVQYLLTKLAEECSEVAKEALKGAQFGTDSEYNGKTNGELIVSEFIDVMTILHMLEAWGDPGVGSPLSALYYNRTEDLAKIRARMPKVCHHIVRSADLGKVEIPPSMIHAITDYADKYIGEYEEVQQ